MESIALLKHRAEQAEKLAAFYESMTRDDEKRLRYLGLAREYEMSLPDEYPSGFAYHMAMNTMMNEQQ